MKKSENLDFSMLRIYVSLLPIHLRTFSLKKSELKFHLLMLKERNTYKLSF